MSDMLLTGKVTGVNGNMVSVAFDDRVTQNEVAFVLTDGNDRLKGEVIRVRGREADIQVFESTTGIKVGNKVEFSGQLLSVELGPGLLTQVYDGLQNPLPQLAAQAGYFLKRGLYIYPLDREKTWDYSPIAKVGDSLKAGDTIGSVPEGIFTHRIMLPFAWAGEWEITWTAEAGAYNIDTVVAKAKNGDEERNITMVQTWPVKIPISCYDEKLMPREPLVTQVRIIDTFFPVAKGGTFCTPGPFGAGK
ncbi:MAG TPA: V-type ATP synthase subunit A, partial [Lentisphaeria bacterium]|nr:V-type ATP synthase subunit A [Lentisphaeria bacterium]